MKINLDHPSFILFLENVSNSIISNVSIDSYFELPIEKKMNIQYVVLKMMKSSINHRAKLNNDEMKAFLVVLKKKNEEFENYEFASILKDIINNFDAVNDYIVPKQAKRKIKTKTDTTENG